MRVSKIIALVAGYTGWSIEYVGQLSYNKLIFIYNEISYKQEYELYQLKYLIAQLTTMWAKGNKSPESIVGDSPKPQEVTINMTKKPTPQKVILGDGNEYILPVINANIMEAIEEELDQDWQSIFEHLRAKQLKVVVHQLLRLQNPNLRLDEVGALLTVEAINNVSKVIPKLM